MHLLKIASLEVCINELSSVLCQMEINLWFLLESIQPQLVDQLFLAISVIVLHLPWFQSETIIDIVKKKNFEKIKYTQNTRLAAYW